MKVSISNYLLSLIAVNFALVVNPIPATAQLEYDFEIVVQSGQVLDGPLVVHTLGSGPSINDKGHVAFTATDEEGVEGLFVKKNGIVESKLGLVFTFTLHGDVQINNQERIVWQELSEDGLFSNIKRIGKTNEDFQIVAKNRRVFPVPQESPFEFVNPWTTMNNQGRVVFSADSAIGPSTFLCTKKDIEGGGNSFIEDYDCSSSGLSGFPQLFPMLADNNFTVLRGGGAETAPLVLFTEATLDSGESDLIGAVDGFNLIGARPGISDDGRLLTFMGVHNTLGGGIFGVQGDVGRPRPLFKIAGDSGLGSVGKNSRIGVNHAFSTSADVFTVAYLATNLTGDLGLYTSEVRLMDPDPPVISEPSSVAEVGGILSGLNGNIQQLGIYDPITNCGRLVFWVSTSSGSQAIIRATPKGTTINSCKIVNMEIVDPVPELLSSSDSTNLLAPPVVVTSREEDLASKGRLVRGVAADGVTQVVLRLPTTSVGEEISFAILDGPGGSQSTSIDRDGALGAVGTEPNASSITVSSQNTSPPLAFAIYRAPKDFPRCDPDGSCMDTNEATRKVTIQVNNSEGSFETEIDIERPPVLLIHGIWDGVQGWDGAFPLTRDGLSRFYVERINYDVPLGKFLSVSPPFDLKFVPRLIQALFLAAKKEINLNQLSWLESAPRILRNMEQAIRNFKSIHRVASVQADIIAHSMGGLVARRVTMLPSYFNRKNFQKGFIHKLITIGTPHLGSPLAENLHDPANNCVRILFAIRGNLAFQRVELQEGQFRGAAGALEGNGDNPNLMSFDLQILKLAPPIPMGIIVGKMGPGQLDTLDTHPGAVALKLLCGQIPFRDPLAAVLFADKWNSQFPNGEDSDGIVGISSQSNLLGIPPGIPIAAIHTNSLNVLGFGKPDERDATTVPPSPGPVQALRLLNTPVTNMLKFTPVP